MRYLLIALLFLTSCGVFRKQKSSTFQRTDSTSVQKFDSLSVFKKDSVSVKQGQKENVDEIVIEFDSSGGQIESPNEAEKAIKIDANDYFSIDYKGAQIGQIKGKIKTLRFRSSQTENLKDSARKQESGVVQVNKSDSVDVEKTEKVEVQTKAKCSFPFGWVMIVIIIGVCIWIARKYGFKVPF